MNFAFFDDRRKTFKRLAIVISVSLVCVFVGLIIFAGNFYNNHSDDVLQYFLISQNYFLRLRAGDFSFFNLSNYFGASIFSDAYYVPIDIFTVLTFLLAFVMDFNFAFGIIELFKIFIGTMAFAYLLHLKKSSNKAIFFAALVYMVSGMNVSLMAFPVFLSLIFYLPLGYIVVLKFLEGKKYFLPLFAFQAILYNFYLAYTLLLFIGIFFIIEILIRHFQENQGWKNLFKRSFIDGTNFIILTLIGVMMGALVLLPSAHFILNNTYRMEMSHHFFRFPIEQYVRLLEKLFSPQIPVGFFGLRNNYITEHLSFFMTMTGLIVCLSVFSLKDKVSNIYKVVLILQIPMLTLPFVSMAFSGTDLPYTRWMAGLMLLNIIIFAHVVTHKDLVFDLKTNGALVRLLVILKLGLFAFIFMFRRLVLNPNASTAYIAHNALITNLVFIGVFLIILVILHLVPKKWEAQYPIILGEIIIAFVIMFTPAFGVHGKINMNAQRSAVNDYLNRFFPSNDNFYRIRVDREIGLGEPINFSRTNLQNTNFRFFHSFYDQQTNEIIEMLYRNDSNIRLLEYQSKSFADLPSPFLHYLFGQRFHVLRSDTTKYMPSQLFTRLVETDDGRFVTYELNNHTPFIVYSEMLEPFVFPGATSVVQMARHKTLLNWPLTDAEGLNLPTVNPVGQFSSNNLFNGSIRRQRVNIEGADYWQYDLSAFRYCTPGGRRQNCFPEQGFLYFYYLVRNAEMRVDGFLRYEDGSTNSCFDRFCHYRERPHQFYIRITPQIERLTAQATFFAEDYQAIEQFLESQRPFNNKQITFRNSNINVSFNRETEGELIVFIPITYSPDFVINNDFRIIRVSGGFLGVVIPEDVKDINFTLSFTVPAFRQGLIISLGGVSLLGIYAGVDVLIKKRAEKHEEV
ncbi:MAG: YfhO family protein [Erysipelotrichales bacterium]|nr:YfhO family protein [Erysipelotrichales bacterium]